MKLTGHIALAARTRQSPGENSRREVPIWCLRPEFPLRSKVPFGQLMRIVRAGFDSREGDQESARAIRELLSQNEVPADLIDSDAPESGGPLARPRLVFEEHSAWRLYINGQSKGAPRKVWRISRNKVASGEWRSLITRAGPSRHPETVAEAGPKAAGGMLTRREHASVEFTSPAGSRVIIDPIFRSTLLRCVFTMPPPAPGGDAAFVTHSHGDHFDLATLDWLAAGGTTVFVPSVPRPSMLARDMFTELGACGLPGKICETGSLTEVGDIRVEALPFFGEQPSAVASPAEPGIRNWGNCYRVESPGFSALVLADSGADPSGSMLAAISDSVMKRGPVDVVLGCLQYLYMPFEADGLACYFTALPVSGLRRDHELYRQGKLPSATLGITGTAIACAEAGAKVFLPYAHGLTGYAQPIRGNAFGPTHGFNEGMACSALSDELKSLGCGTAVLSWNPGDSWYPG